jgi:hypothetical protein
MCLEGLGIARAGARPGEALELAPRAVQRRTGRERDAEPGEATLELSELGLGELVGTKP